jgi:hypothetical protein
VIAFSKHLLKAFTLFGSWQDASRRCLQHRDSLRVEYPDFGFCVTTFIDVDDEPVAGDGFICINRSFELETHPCRQPADLPANFGDEAGGQKAMGNGRLEPAQLRVARIAVNGVVVSRDLRELTNVILCKTADYGESVTDLETIGGTFSRAFHKRSMVAVKQWLKRKMYCRSRINRGSVRSAAPAR